MENDKKADNGNVRKSILHKLFDSKLKIVVWVIGIILLVIYFMGVNFYGSHFFENSTLEGVNVSSRTRDEVVGIFEDNINARKMLIEFKDSAVLLDSSAFNPEITHGEEVAQLIENQNNLLWFVGYVKPSHYSSDDFVSIDDQTLENTIRGLDQTNGTTPPSDAYVSYQDSGFVIVPEDIGTTMDVDSLIGLIKENYLLGEETFDVVEQGLYYQAELKSDNPQLMAKLELAKQYCDARITYTPDAEHTFVLDENTLLTWLTKDSAGNWTKNDDVFKRNAEAFIRTFTRYYYTLGITRNFKTATGNTVTISGGSLGQYVLVRAETNNLVELISDHAKVSRKPALFGYGYEGNQGIGNTYVEINLSAQHLYMIQNGKIVFETDQIVTGLASDPDRKTPSGCYYVYYKQIDRVLRGTQNPDGTWPYEVPVKYWMAFNRGIGMHDATYRSAFGGNIYTYAGSHGCVNMRYSEAAKMYSYTQIGTPVICYY